MTDTTNENTDAQEGEELAALATALVDQARARGEELSFADAVACVLAAADDNNT